MNFINLSPPNYAMISVRKSVWLTLLELKRFCSVKLFCAMKKELLKRFFCVFQNLLENFDDIVITVGSGGSAAGIAIANYLTGSKLKYDFAFVYRNAG